MNLYIYTASTEGRRWQAAARQRLRAVLRRLAGVLQRVELRLGESNGAAPGLAKRCQVEARLPGGETVRAEVNSRSWPEAVELVATRLRRAVLDALRVSPAAPAGWGQPARLPLAGAAAGDRRLLTRRAGQRWR